MKIEIKCRFSGSVLFAHEQEDNTVKMTVEAAVKARANLAGAYLARANLAGAYLDGAYLDGAYLAGANLVGENKLVGKRPIFQIGPIGSRSAYFVAYLTSSGLVLKTGCFTGSISEFREKLAEEHGDNLHAKEYEAALTLIEKHAELWPAEEETEEAK